MDKGDRVGKIFLEDKVDKVGKVDNMDKMDRVDKVDSVAEQPFILLLLDYNEDRGYDIVDHEEGGSEENPDYLHEMRENEDKKNEALIYIHTLGNSYY